MLAQGFAFVPVGIMDTSGFRLVAFVPITVRGAGTLTRRCFRVQGQSPVSFDRSRTYGKCTRLAFARARSNNGYVMALGGDAGPKKREQQPASEAQPSEPPSNHDGAKGADAAASSQAENETHLTHEEATGEQEGEEEAMEGEDLLNSPPFLKRKIEILEKELQSLREELEAARKAADSERDSVLRLSADFDNFRRRVAREKQQEELRGRMRAVQQLLPAIDNFDRAAQTLKPQSEEAQKVHQNYQVLCKQVLDAFAKIGVETLDPVGMQFDPKIHEAIQRVESTEHPEGYITHVFQKGYIMRDVHAGQATQEGAAESTLIRAAVCAVSMGPGPGPGPAAPASSEGASAAETDLNATETPDDDTPTGQNGDEASK